jgi:UDP-glucose 4-epimerase
MSKVTVFGGSGFLGSHVADELSNRGFDVLIFDVQKSPFLKANQQFIQGDISDEAAVTEAAAGADYIYNFAGMADINESKKFPKRAVELNILGNLNILEAAVKHHCKRFVYASTVYVFSESGSFYRVTKQASEKFIELYQEDHQLPYTILRYGSLYGRRADERNMIHTFVKDALTKGVIEYPGSGEELREYIHVSDAATASVDILNTQYANTHLVITGHQTLRVRDVMLMISEMLEMKAKINCRNGMDAHYAITPYTYKPKLGKKLTVNPFVDMGQGILDCIHEVADLMHLQKPNV